MNAFEIILPILIIGFFGYVIYSILKKKDVSTPTPINPNPPALRAYCYFISNNTEKTLTFEYNDLELGFIFDLVESNSSKKVCSFGYPVGDDLDIIPCGIEDCTQSSDCNCFNSPQELV